MGSHRLRRCPRGTKIRSPANLKRHALDKDAKGGGSISGVKIPKAGLRAAVLLTAPTKSNAFDTFSVVQEEEGNIVGGGTYVVVASKQ